MKQITGFGLRSSALHGNKSFADELNQIFSRFDTHDFSQELTSALENMQRQVHLDEPVQITEESVQKSFEKDECQQSKRSRWNMRAYIEGMWY